MKRGEVLDTFQTFVDPERALPGKIIDLTGITDAMLQGAPKIGEILPDFLKFCGGRPLCAHNADFDVGFVTAACERLGIPFQPTYADTLILAQNLMEGREGKRFLSIEEFSLACPKVSKTHIEDLKAAGAFGDLPETSQITLF